MNRKPLGTASVAPDLADGVTLTYAAVGRRLLAGAAGPAFTLVAAVLLPVVAARILGADEFASWALLATVTTLANGIDLGAPVALTALLASGHPGRTLLIHAAKLTLVGTVIVVVFGGLAWAGWRSAQGQALEGWLLVAVAGAAGLRSLLNLVVAAGLAIAGGTSVRTRALALSSVVQVAVGVVALMTGAGLYALPLSLGAGSVAGLVAAIPLLRDPGLSEVGSVPGLSGWAFSRTAIAALSGILNQFDKWLVGLVAGPATLAGYELAWRIAIVPKLLASVLSQSLVADIRHSSQPAYLYRRAWQLAAGTVAVAAVASLGLSPLLQAATGVSLPMSVVLLLIVAHAVHALTAVPTAVLSGLLRPWAEVPYLAFAASIAATIGAASVVGGTHGLAIAAAPLGLVAGTGFLFLTLGHDRRSQLFRPVHPSPGSR